MLLLRHEKMPRAWFGWQRTTLLYALFLRKANPTKWKTRPVIGERIILYADLETLKTNGQSVNYDAEFSCACLQMRRRNPRAPGPLLGGRKSFWGVSIDKDGTRINFGESANMTGVFTRHDKPTVALSINHHDAATLG